MEIREMREDDVDDVLEVIGRHDDDDIDAAQAYFDVLFEDEEGMADRGDRHYVAVEADRIVAVGGVMPDEEEGRDIWWLAWFYVDPKHQHTGMGQALLDRGLAWARSQGGRKIYVDVSDYPTYDNARSFYAKNGFVEEGRLLEFYAPDEACIFMGKRLTD